MNKFLAVILISTLGLAQAKEWRVNSASVTTTAETTVRIPNSNPGDVIVSVIINDCSSTAGSTFTLYDSSMQVANSFGALDTSTTPVAGIGQDCRRQVFYEHYVSSSITYTTSAAGASITILWFNDYGNDGMDSDTDP